MLYNFTYFQLEKPESAHMTLLHDKHKFATTKSYLTKSCHPTLWVTFGRLPLVIPAFPRSPQIDEFPLDATLSGSGTAYRSWFNYGVFGRCTFNLYITEFTVNTLACCMTIEVSL